MGDLIGARQAGGFEVRHARLPADTDLLDRARELAIRLIEADPALQRRRISRCASARCRARWSCSEWAERRCLQAEPELTAALLDSQNGLRYSGMEDGTGSFPTSDSGERSPFSRISIRYLRRSTPPGTPLRSDSRATPVSELHPQPDTCRLFQGANSGSNGMLSGLGVWRVSSHTKIAAEPSNAASPPNSNRRARRS